MMLPLAHAGHVIADLAVYGAPIFILLGALAVSTRNSRRKG